MAGRKVVLGMRDRGEWRRWLETHHSSSPGVWLELSKKGAWSRGIVYEEALEEALAFGWIDGRADRVDEERYKVMFTPRRPGSQWSAGNKRRVGSLTERGLMTPAGTAKVEAAKLDGSWSSHDDAERNVVPPDLLEELERRGAKDAFFRLPASRRKQFLFRISDAKRPETREKRIRGAVSAALEEDRERRRK